ncbi:unnamed protein product [Phaedon cochleariae]|uniref:Methyltransferase-like protein 4 n=1 Tax=Phaedon cochleariae TaxID=80249 RepID=A0A9P0DSK7_PHACE|nr:unnamed protein product [Phaedon cochleariae]
MFAAPRVGSVGTLLQIIYILHEKSSVCYVMMSKIFQNEYGIYISHKLYLDSIYDNVNGESYSVRESLFNICNPYKIEKVHKENHINDDHLQKEHENVRRKFHLFISDREIVNLFLKEVTNSKNNNNHTALKTADLIYEESGKHKVENAFGANTGPAVKKMVNLSIYLFPENSTFYAKDVRHIHEHLQSNYFDFILLDPPWWNKYIRRKRKKSNDAYNMMFNLDLKNIPIENIMKPNGLVAVWCTNSEQNFNYLVNIIFPKWNIQYIGKWYWMKITNQGKPVCPFSEPPGKQPYEKIVFGCTERSQPNPKDGQLVVSVPSAIHSHKPPLIEIMQDFLPANPVCLEIFARYLLPGWTSYGNEVLRLQHESMFSNS